MAKLQVDGLDSYIDKIGKLYVDIDSFNGIAVYEGSKILADAIKAEIDNIPANSLGTSNPSLQQKQKDGLKNGLGVSKLDKTDGFANVRIGFAHYNSYTTKKFPNGQPNPLIARAIIKGTSFRQPYNFVGKAASKVKKQVLETMKKTLEDKIKEVQ